jgi:cytochrome c oxidase assembly factor 2
LDSEGKNKGAIEESADEEDESLVPARKAKRECPAPKPGGVVGEMLGFKKSSNDGEGASKPP